MNEEGEVFDLSRRGSFERMIAGALKDSIQQHGPITKGNVSSAAKRVIHAVKQWNRKVKEKQKNEVAK